MKLSASSAILTSPYSKVLEPSYLSQDTVIQGGLVTKVISQFAKFFITKQPSGFVINQTIFITGSEKLEFQIPILAHKLVHIEQTKQKSYPIFTLQYLKEYLQSGYQNISFEKEAYDFQKNVICAIVSPKT